MTLEGVASRLKIGTKVDVVVNFAVDDEVQAAILVRHGLLPPLAQINDGETRVTEILPVQIDVRAHAVVLQIHHFSGYTVASAAAADSVPDLR